MASMANPGENTMKDRRERDRCEPGRNSETRCEIFGNSDTLEVIR